jgi:predicted small secreted protein
MVRKLVVLGLLGLMASLAACNTVAGAGTDLSNSAHWVQHQF